jgi:hypothetical protein
MCHTDERLERGMLISTTWINADIEKLLMQKQFKVSD